MTFSYVLPKAMQVYLTANRNEIAKTYRKMRKDNPAAARLAFKIFKKAEREWIDAITKAQFDQNPDYQIGLGSLLK